MRCRHAAANGRALRLLRPNGPGEFLTGRGLDVRPHPHIGLSTVTYLFDGAIQHRDSLDTDRYIHALRPWRDANRVEMEARAATVRRAFAGLPACPIDSLGAYFVYLRLPFPGLSAWQVVEDLAIRHGLMLLPASAFAGSSDHLGVSFANIDSPGI